jgi:hypothetical protein
MKTVVYGQTLNKLTGGEFAIQAILKNNDIPHS